MSFREEREAAVRDALRCNCFVLDEDHNRECLMRRYEQVLAMVMARERAAGEMTVNFGRDHKDDHDWWLRGGPYHWPTIFEWPNASELL